MARRNTPEDEWYEQQRRKLLAEHERHLKKVQAGIRRDIIYNAKRLPGDLAEVLVALDEGNLRPAPRNKPSLMLLQMRGLVGKSGRPTETGHDVACYLRSKRNPSPKKNPAPDRMRDLRKLTRV